MTRHHYPTLLAAALAAAFIGAAAAQTQSDDASRMPASKGMAQADQTRPAQDQTDKMKGQEGGQNSPMNGQNQSDQTKGQTRGQSPKSPMYGENPSHPGQAQDHNAMTKDHEAMKSQHEAMASEHHATSGKKAKSAKTAGAKPSGMEHHAMSSHASAKHAGKSKRPSEEAATPDEKAYREALRDCVKQQDSSHRDSCLDGAIERFHRNA